MNYKNLIIIIVILTFSVSYYGCKKKPEEKTELEKINIISEVENNDLDKINDYFAKNLPIDLYYQRESDGKTALHIAVVNENIEIIEVLFKKGSQYTIRANDFDNKKPLDYAIKKNNHKIIKTVCTFFDSESIYFSYEDEIGKKIITLCRNNQELKEAFQRVLDVWLLNEIGDGLSLRKNYRKIEYLISIGADINGAGKHFDRTSGVHPLYLAVLNNDLEFTKFLIEKGSLIDIHFDDEPGDTPAGETPLMCATKNENIEIVKLLIANGADVNLGASYNETPLSYAIRHGNEEIKTILIKQGAKKANNK